jgi:hypothetical protein
MTFYDKAPLIAIHRAKSTRLAEGIWVISEEMALSFW